MKFFDSVNILSIVLEVVFNLRNLALTLFNSETNVQFIKVKISGN